MAAVTKITIVQGEDFTLHLQFNDQAGDPYDLTNCTVRFIVRKRAGLTPVVSKTVTSFDSPTEGKADIDLTGADTDLDIRAWYCQIIMTDTDGNDHPSIYTIFQVTNFASTTREISVLLNVGTVSPVDGQVSRRWVDANGNVWVETVGTDGALTTTQVPTDYVGLTLALQST